MKKIICILICLMLVSIVYAQTAEELYAEVEGVLEPLIGKEVPMYGNELVNVYLMDGSPIGYAMTSEGVFSEFGQGEKEDPTMNIYIQDGSVVKEIMGAENPLDKFYELKGEGKIKVDPVGFFKSVKYFFMNIFATILSWFT